MKSSNDTWLEIYIFDAIEDGYNTVETAKAYVENRYPDIKINEKHFSEIFDTVLLENISMGGNG